MYHFNPINLDNGTFQIHPLRKSDLLKQDKMVEDLFEIFSDVEGLPFNKEKIVLDRDTIANQLFGVTLGYQKQIRYTHFITLKQFDKIIGEVMIISPKDVEPTYKIKDTWLIEYYLNRQLWRKGIMTGAILAITQSMQEQKISNIGAIVDRNNFPSIKVLEKSGFKKLYEFDMLQDYYKL